MTDRRGRARGGGPKGLNRVGGMDAFNYNMLGLLKTKEERLELMERMSMMNDNVGTYTLPEPELTIGGYRGTETDWSTRIHKLREDRDKDPQWVTRFAKHIDGLNVIETDPKKIKATARKAEMKEIGKHMLMRINVKAPDIPPVPIMTSTEDMEIVHGRAGGAQFCVKCWLGAGAGARRLNCKHCSNFICSRCVAPTANVDAKVAAQIEAVSKGQGQGAEFVCPFCLDEVTVTNRRLNRNYERAVYTNKCINAVIKMQSSIRRSHQLKWFKQAVNAAKLMQRAIRARIYWKQAELKKKLEKRPVRIRIHDCIDLFLRREDLGPPAVKLPQESFKVGDTPAGAYEEIFGVDKSRENDGSLEDAMHNLLLTEHESSPSYQEQCNTQKRPKGTLFLTVSLHQSSEDSYNKQEFRIDIPLEKDDDAAPERIYVRKPRRGEEATSPMIHKMGSHESVDSDMLQSLSTQYRMQKYYISSGRQYILSPACTAEVTMRMTLSAVTDWPKAEVIGQSEVNLFHYMLWKRCTSYIQDFSTRVLWESLPSSGDQSVLLLSIRRSLDQKKKTDVRLPAKDEQPNSPTKPGRTPSKVNYLVRGGFLTWSVLPFTEMSDNQYGQLTALSGASLDSARRRMWLVLVDHVLYIYNVNTSKPKNVYPMISVSCVYVEGQVGLFKLRTPSETYYLVDDDEKSGRMWFRKLYEQGGKTKSYEAAEAALQTPWAKADIALEKQLAWERENTALGTTSASRKNNLLLGLKKATSGLTAVDDTKGMTTSHK